jgi:hypothetical protein
MPHAHNGNGRVLTDPVELGSDIRGEVDPPDQARDHRLIQLSEPNALLQAVARLDDDRTLESCRGEHGTQVGRAEVAGDRRHGLRIDPVLRIEGPVPQVHMSVDADGHPRCHTSSMGCHSAPGLRSSAILTWHGSVCVHHSCETGSSAIRRMSAS